MRDQPFGPVRELDRDHLARPEPEIEERADKPVREAIQLGIGQTPAAVNDGEPVASRAPA